MSFLYPRTVEVRRLRTVAVQGGVQEVGLLPYGGAEQSDGPEVINGEEVLFKNICCDIQAHQSGRTKGGLLPTDATEKPLWLIIVPTSSGVPKGGIRDRDIIYDDEQYRYIVAQAWWTGLAYDLTCVRLEA
jgi:hypothetical protein